MSNPRLRLGLALCCLAGAGLSGGVAGAGVPDCAPGATALRALVATEYAFADAAQTSIRGAFLEYLAADALVLNPGPTPGRAVYEAAPPSHNKLEWYPSVVGIAGSGDLGFTSGPWVLTSAAGGARAQGHFLTVWRRDSTCSWHIQFDGGVSHAAQPVAEPRLVPGQLPSLLARAPSAQLIDAHAPARALEDFEAVARQDGVAPALRTYARDEGFIFFTDEQAPSGVGAATVFLTAHPVSGRWQESARGASADSTLLYSVGEIKNGQEVATHAYLEIWQYDPKVANWGLRALLITELPPPKQKS